MTEPYNTPVASRTLVERAIGAAMLDVPTYEEVEADRSATGQAAAVVGVAAVASAIGASGQGTSGVIGGLFSAFVGWAIAAALAYFVGTRFFGGTADWGELLRTLGFAQAPRVLSVVGVIPGLGWVVLTVVSIWVLVTQVVAIRQALDVDTGKAILVAVISTVIMWALIVIPALVFGALVLGGLMLT